MGVSVWAVVAGRRWHHSFNGPRSGELFCRQEPRLHLLDFCVDTTHYHLPMRLRYLTQHCYDVRLLPMTLLINRMPRRAFPSSPEVLRCLSGCDRTLQCMTSTWTQPAATQPLWPASKHQIPAHKSSATFLWEHGSPIPAELCALAYTASPANALLHCNCCLLRPAMLRWPEVSSFNRFMPIKSAP